ncbi:hypothetical protein [Mammaliicoccus sciuri]|uniref:hypothetical protein n=1 Tax=Mammaliicoccus sciuri TaxID=1296 RepID=UPI003F547C05
MIIYKKKNKFIQAIHYRPQIMGGVEISDIEDLKINTELDEMKFKIAKLVSELNNDYFYTDIKKITLLDNGQNIVVPIYFFQIGYITNVKLNINQDIKTDFERNTIEILNKTIKKVFKNYKNTLTDLLYYELKDID